MAVPSPCVHVCSLDEITGLCRGCARTLDEIARWSAMSDADKLRVWEQIHRRRGGHATRSQPSGGTREQRE